MKKIVRDVLITIVAILMISLLFFKIGWFTTFKDVLSLLGIAIIVIVSHLLIKGIKVAITALKKRNE